MSFSLDKDFSKQIPGRLDELNDSQILIIGDVGLDEYIVGDVRKISPEAPVPVVEVNSESQKLGLSCNVAANVSSFGGSVELIGVVGQDRASDQIATLLEQNKVGSSGLVVDSSRPTTRKIRVMAEQQQVVRVDFEQKQFISADVEEKILEKVDEKIGSCTGVVIEDYAKGVLTERVCQGIIEKAQAAGKPVLVDPNRTTPVSYYRGADLIKPNHDESIVLSGLPFDEIHRGPNFIEELGQTLLKKSQSKYAVITRGKQGMSLFKDGESMHIPTFAREVFDVTGAGDTVIAVLAMAWSSGWSLPESCTLANHAAGFVVSKLGCVTCRREDILPTL